MRCDARQTGTALVVVALVLAALSFGPLVAPVAAHQSSPSPSPSFSPSTPTPTATAAGPCGDSVVSGLAGGRVECLHEDVREQFRTPLDTTPADLGVNGGATEDGGPPCIGDGTSGNRVRALYVRPADRPDRYAEVVAQIRGWAGDVSEVYRESAAQTGGEREVRWLMPDCELLVDHVVLSAQGDDSIAATRSELRALGYTNDERKYLVWMDSNVICGQGYLFVDDRADPELNANNQLSALARVDSGLQADGTLGTADTRCWGYAEAHELGHNLGAVQHAYVDDGDPGNPIVYPGAPHQTPTFHCTDEWDLMCYDDGVGPGALTYPCGTAPGVLPADQSNDNRLDCGHDDYFYAAPPPPGPPDPPEDPPVEPPPDPLAGRWNIATSSWLEGGAVPPSPAVVPPPANDAFATAIALEGYLTTADGSTVGATAEDLEPVHGGETADGSAWWSWTPPTDGLVRVTTTPLAPVPFGGSMVPTVAVYEGLSLDELLLVPSQEELDAAGHQTAMTFTVTPGARYWIAVDDWDRRGGAFTLTAGPPPNGFSDVGPADDPAVDWMTAVGITTGYDDGTFKPAGQLKRQQIAAFLYRLAGQPHFTPPSTQTFKDVRKPTSTSAGHPFYREIEWLAASGITTGYGDGTFRSLVTLNRQQIAAFLYRIAGAGSTSTAEPFDDVKPGHGFHREIAWAHAQGILDGTTATTFSSKQVMTRATLADAFHRLAGTEAAWDDTPPPTVWFTPSP